MSPKSVTVRRRKGVQVANRHAAKPAVKGYNLRKISTLFPEVTKVVDATESITAQVTSRDNKTGSVKDARDCAMARACKREFDLDGVIISLSTAYTIKGDTATRYAVPTSLAREIVTFDRAKQFEPGTYRLVPFSEGRLIKAGGARGGSGPHKSRGTGTPPQFKHITEGVRRFPDRAIHKGEGEV
jgi:hypothetical protein